MTAFHVGRALYSLNFFATVAEIQNCNKMHCGWPRERYSSVIASDESPD